MSRVLQECVCGRRRGKGRERVWEKHGWLEHVCSAYDRDVRYAPGEKGWVGKGRGEEGRERGPCGFTLYDAEKEWKSTSFFPGGLGEDERGSETMQSHSAYVFSSCIIRVR